MSWYVASYYPILIYDGRWILAISHPQNQHLCTLHLYGATEVWTCFRAQPYCIFLIQLINCNSLIEKKIVIGPSGQFEPTLRSTRAWEATALPTAPSHLFSTPPNRSPFKNWMNDHHKVCLVQVPLFWLCYFTILDIGELKEWGNAEGESPLSPSTNFFFKYPSWSTLYDIVFLWLSPGRGTCG